MLDACRTARPGGGTPFPPLQANSAESALEELHQRRAAFREARAFSRIRLTRGSEVQSFRARLHVTANDRLELQVFTPVGTTAGTLIADGNRVTVKSPGRTVSGTSEELSRSYGFFAQGLSPAEVALLMIGLPPRRDLTYEAGPSGLARAAVGDLVVRYDPPAFPPTRVVLERVNEKIEIEHLEIVAAP